MIRVIRWSAMGLFGASAAFTGWAFVEGWKALTAEDDPPKKITLKRSSVMWRSSYCKPGCACNCNQSGCGCHERPRPYEPNRPKEMPK